MKPKYPRIIGRDFYTKIGATPQEADAHVAADIEFNETGRTADLFAQQIHVIRGTLFRRAAHRRLRLERRPDDVHLSVYSDGKYVTLKCTGVEVRPDCKEPIASEGHEPVVFSGEGHLYTFNKWWATCTKCR